MKYLDCRCRLRLAALVSASVRSAATSKYANGGAVGSRCMILAGSAVHNPVSSHRPKKNSAVTRLPRPPQGIFVCTCTFQGACYLKGPHLERETFLSASFTKENCQSSVHLINVSPFSAPARKSNISLRTCFSFKFSRQVEGC